MSTANQAAWRGLPLKERSPDHVREALSNQPDEVVQAGIKLLDYARSNSLGLSRLASQSGIGAGILSQFFNGAYDKGNYDQIAERINTFFWRLEQKELYGGLRGFVELDITKALWTVFDKTRIVRRIQPIEGPEQVGKSRAAEEYSERNNSGRTIYLQLSGGSRSGAGDFIWSLAQRLDIPYTVKMREKRLRIREALAACDLIIVDEAHVLFSWTDSAQAEWWDYLRTDIFDNGARGVVLLLTNSDLLRGLQAWRKRTGYNVGQLLGRMRNEIMRIDPAEDITESDVAALAGRYYEPGPEIVRELHDIAGRHQLGHFGLILDIMNEAWTRAKAARRKLDDRTVQATAREVLEGLKARKDLYA